MAVVYPVSSRLLGWTTHETQSEKEVCPFMRVDPLELNPERRAPRTPTTFFQTFEQCFIVALGLDDIVVLRRLY